MRLKSCGAQIYSARTGFEQWIFPGIRAEIVRNKCNLLHVAGIVIAIALKNIYLDEKLLYKLKNEFI
jgi:hypothetical protein